MHESCGNVSCKFCRLILMCLDLSLYFICLLLLQKFCCMLTSCLEQLPAKTDLRLWPFAKEARGTGIIESPVNYTCMAPSHVVCGNLK